MTLPSRLRIVPPLAPVKATLSLPGSKSVTNRALTLAALAEGTVRIEGALWSDDVEVMVRALEELGYAVRVLDDAAEPSNRTIVVEGRGAAIPVGGTLQQPRELFVGLAGTTARFLTAMLCLGRGVYRLTGTSAMHQRPQGALFSALRQLGYRIDAEGDRLPALVHGGGARGGHCDVSIRESSQFASALLLSAGRGGFTVRVPDEAEEAASYVEMTRELIRVFPSSGGVFQVEADASGGSYFQAARHLLTHSQIEILNWPTSGWQIDARFPNYLPLPASVSRKTDLGDSIMTAIVLGPLATHPTRFEELGRLRHQECERVEALRTELTRCGARVVEVGDTLTIEPGPLHGAQIECYGDHRMAMCFATLGLVIEDVVLREPACVKKTFPGFFSKLAATPPHGLGVRVCDAETGRVLEASELIA